MTGVNSGDITVIVGISCVGIVVLVFMAECLAKWCARRRRMKAEEYMAEQSVPLENIVVIMNPAGSNPDRRYSLKTHTRA